MNTHYLKTSQPYFDAIREGLKTFDVRLNDRGFQTGDRLRLAEDGPDICHCDDRACFRAPLILNATVMYVYSGDPRFGHGNLPRSGGIEQGYVVLGLGNVTLEKP